MPLLVRWPGNVSAEVRKPTPVISTDMLPTNVELARGDPSRLGPLDGVSLKPLLTGKGVIEREGLFLVRH